MKIVLLAVVVAVLAGTASAHDRRFVPDGARLVDQWAMPAGGGVPEQLVVHWRQSMFHGVWFWEQRAKIHPPDQLKEIEEFEKNSGRFLFGTRVGELYAGLVIGMLRNRG